MYLNLVHQERLVGGSSSLLIYYPRLVYYFKSHLKAFVYNFFCCGSIEMKWNEIFQNNLQAIMMTNQSRLEWVVFVFFFIINLHSIHDRSCDLRQSFNFCLLHDYNFFLFTRCRLTNAIFIWNFVIFLNFY